VKFASLQKEIERTELVSGKDIQRILKFGRSLICRFFPVSFHFFKLQKYSFKQLFSNIFFS